MDIKGSNPLGAYANAAKLNDDSKSSSGSDFASFLKQKGQEAEATLRNAEKMSGLGLMGAADEIDVVSAVTDADMTLQTIKAVRDQLVTAVREIFSMPV